MSSDTTKWTVRTDEPVIFHNEPEPFPPATIPYPAMPHLAAFINALKPHHYRAAADSLRKIAEHRLATATDALAHARAEGINEAARLLERALKDLDDEGTSE